MHTLAQELAATVSLRKLATQIRPRFLWSFRFKPDIIIESRHLNDNMPKHMKELTEDALMRRDLHWEMRS